MRINRYLDVLDESASGIIRLAYLLAGVIGVASYFSDGNVPAWFTHDLNTILPWVLAAAVEIHTYLTARRVRRAYQTVRAAAPGSAEHRAADTELRVNLWILGGLILFECYNQLQYLAGNWHPPHIPLTLPGPWPYLIRATFVPAAFLAAAFLAPADEGMAAQVQTAAHQLTALAFRAATKQWRRRLGELEQRGRDLSGALALLVEDEAERRVIATIHAALTGQPITVTAPAATPDVAPAAPPDPDPDPDPDPPPPPDGRTVRPLDMPRRRRTDAGRRSDEAERRWQADRARVRALLLADPTMTARELQAQLHTGLHRTSTLAREVRRELALTRQQTG
jgi:hypothetical protein